MKLFFVIASVIAVCTVSECCMEGWVEHNGMCYFLSHDKATWYESLAVCSSVYGNLAEPDSPDVQNFLVSQARPKSATTEYKYWIGVSDIFKETKWIFLSTQHAVQTSYWYPGEPNNQVGTGVDNSNEDCVLFNWDGKGAWNDYSCTSRYLFICQKENADVNIVG